MSAKQRELSGFSWRGKQKLKFPPTHINKFNYFKYVFVISFNLKEKKNHKVPQLCMVPGKPQCILQGNRQTLNFANPLPASS